MKRIEEKLKRKVKFWRVSYLQASERERLSMGMLAVLILVYMWWASVIF